MIPHLIWAFVALCALGVVVYLRRRTLEDTAMQDELLRQEKEIRGLRGESVLFVSTNTKICERLDAIEADLKPIKAKYAASELGRLGGAR